MKKPTPKSKRKPAPSKKDSLLHSDIGSALAMGAAASIGSRLIGSIFNSAPVTISIEIESAEVTENVSLKTHGLRLTIKPKPEPQPTKEEPSNDRKSQAAYRIRRSRTANRRR